MLAGSAPRMRTAMPDRCPVGRRCPGDYSVTAASFSSAHLSLSWPRARALASLMGAGQKQLKLDVKERSFKTRLRADEGDPKVLPCPRPRPHSGWSIPHRLLQSLHITTS